MIKMILFMLCMAAAFYTGYKFNESQAADRVSLDLFTIDNQASTLAADRLARERHMQSRVQHRESMINMFDRVLDLIEQDIQNKVAHQHNRDDN
jgi:hypothetical protein